MIGSHRMCETWRSHGLAVEVGEIDALGRQDGHIAVVQKEHVAGMAQDGGHIGGDEKFVIAQADRRPAGRSARPRFCCGSRLEMTLMAKTPVICLHGLAHRVFQVAVEIFLYQMRDDFGIGFGVEVVAFRGQLLACSAR